MGNRGIINSGDIQWMTAGSGIIHQEMPRRVDGRMRGLQLWVNLPAQHKMMNPRYQEIGADSVPVVEMEGGVNVRLIAGELNGNAGPVREIVCDPQYLDITVPNGCIFELGVPVGHTVFAFVLEGRGVFDARQPDGSGEGDAVLFEDGDGVRVKAVADELRFLLISGMPIGEPVAWRGPIVMNTDEELTTAFEEYRRGNFIKT
jgi:redox-sensitive bicupin YhaK (pirin superfamily)